MRQDATDGFPTDYLLARIRGRATALISDWQYLLAGGLAPDASDERIWEAFLAELQWLHAQMNRGLRAQFAPLFALFEIKTIVLALRNKAIRRTAQMERLLARSLLAGDVKESLLRAMDVRAAIAALSEPLASVYDEGNLPAFEDALMRISLQDTAAKNLDPVMKEFFVLFIDLRNVMLLYKHLRWGIAEPSLFIAGGSVELPRLQEIHDSAGLDELVTSVTGIESAPAAAGEGALETILLRSMTRRLMKMRRMTDGAGLIVVYVWRLYVQTRNLAVLHHGAELDPQTLERELIL